MKSCFRICCGLLAIATEPIAAECPTHQRVRLATQPDWEKLTLHASAATQPWTEYRLMPSSVDQQDGNAVPFYLMKRPAKFLIRRQRQRGARARRTTSTITWIRRLRTFHSEICPGVARCVCRVAQLRRIWASRRDARWDQFWNVDWSDALIFPESICLSQRPTPHRKPAELPCLFRDSSTPLAGGTAQYPDIDGHRAAYRIRAGDNPSACGAGVYPTWCWLGRSWQISEDKSANLYWSLSVLPHPLILIRRKRRWTRTMHCSFVAAGIVAGD